MTLTEVKAESFRIEGVEALDHIHVFWLNVGPGRGHVTIICFGSSWTAYFGGMMGLTIQAFFAQADVGYLVSKMGTGPTLKARKKDDAYLARIIKAVQESLPK